MYYCIIYLFTCDFVPLLRFVFMNLPVILLVRSFNYPRIYLFHEFAPYIIHALKILLIIAPACEGIQKDKKKLVGQGRLARLSPGVDLGPLSLAPRRHIKASAI